MMVKNLPKQQPPYHTSKVTIKIESNEWTNKQIIFSVDAWCLMMMVDGTNTIYIYIKRYEEREIIYAMEYVEREIYLMFWCLLFVQWIVQNKGYCIHIWHYLFSIYLYSDSGALSIQRCYAIKGHNNDEKEEDWGMRIYGDMMKMTDWMRWNDMVWWQYIYTDETIKFIEYKYEIKTLLSLFNSNSLLSFYVDFSLYRPPCRLI